MKIFKNFSLLNFNTFYVNVIADYFVIINNIIDLYKIFNNKKMWVLPKLILGSGSNILFIKKFTGLVIKNNLKGYKIIKDNNFQVFIKFYSGEIWNDIVNLTINSNFGGLENLSYIPGTIGGAVVQNIGAYGSEIKDTLFSVEVFKIKTGKILNLYYKKDFWLGYRNSSFKKEFHNKFFIISVILIFRKKISHKIILTYNSLIKELQMMNINIPTIKDINIAVTSIRKKKLLDPIKIGNAGSFFKNPIINNKILNNFLLKNCSIIKKSKNKIKLSAAQLIEKCGWKGIKIGNTGVYKRHALVIINYGNASGKEINNLSNNIIKDVKLKFNIQLEKEVIVI